MGLVSLRLYQHEDTFTVQEIFGIDCYKSDSHQIVVDFGSNIGISAAYFLTRNATSFVYCFEPLAENAAKLRSNLCGFQDRYELTEAAVSDRAGILKFNVEPSGRYSGLENLVGTESTFPAVAANTVLDRIIQKHGRIDLLKIDIEGAEHLFLSDLPSQTLANIRLIYVEGTNEPELPGFDHDKSVSGIHRYRRRSVAD